MTLHCSQLGFDTCNRESTLGNPLEPPLLMTDIAFIGWSWSEVAHATCVEAQPGSKELELANAKFVEDTELAPVKEDSIRYGTLSCGHTNQGHRCIFFGTPSNCELLSRDGHFCLEALKARDAQMYKAVMRGMKWNVLRWRTRFLYPAALVLIARARNVAGHVQRKVTEVEGLSQMHSTSAAQMRAGKSVDWSVIRRAVLRSRPTFASSIDELISFLAAKSGGVEGTHLRFFGSVHRQFVPSNRTMPASIFVAGADFPFFISGMPYSSRRTQAPKNASRTASARGSAPPRLGGSAR